jgi:hypothetical protein
MEEGANTQIFLSLLFRCNERLCASMKKKREVCIINCYPGCFATVCGFQEGFDKKVPLSLLAVYPIGERETRKDTNLSCEWENSLTFCRMYSTDPPTKGE